MRAIVRQVFGSSLVLIELVDHFELKDGEPIHVFSEDPSFAIGVVDEIELNAVLVEATAAVASAHAAVSQSLDITSDTMNDRRSDT